MNKSSLLRVSLGILITIVPTLGMSDITSCDKYDRLVPIAEMQYWDKEELTQCYFEACSEYRELLGVVKRGGLSISSGKIIELNMANAKRVLKKDHSVTTGLTCIYDFKGCKGTWEEIKKCGEEK